MTKDNLKIIIIGHVDHGKSSLIGRLLLETKSLPQGKIAEIKKVAKELGKKTELAFLVDQLKEEREQNITIDTAQVFFKTPRRNYVVIDAPGHLKFIKNMITGATQAEAAVLIIDVQEGLMEQTRRHAYIISILGIDKIIVILNKMDLVQYKQERFLQVKNQVEEFLKKLKLKSYLIIPGSAQEGSNILKKSAKLNWFKGPTLIKALDCLKLSPKSETKALRFPIQDIYMINKENISVGSIVSGRIKQGQEVIILPGLQKTSVKFILSFDKKKQTKARAGDNIGVALNTALPVKRGDVITQKENLLKLTNCFQVSIFWMAEQPMYIGKIMTLRCATQEVECVVEKIEKQIDSATLEILQLNANELRQNEVGMVVLKTDRMLVAERFDIIAELGRFVLEQQTQICAGGIIINKLLPAAYNMNLPTR